MRAPTPLPEDRAVVPISARDACGGQLHGNAACRKECACAVKVARLSMTCRRRPPPRPAPSHSIRGERSPSGECVMVSCMHMQHEMNIVGHCFGVMCDGVPRAFTGPVIFSSTGHGAYPIVGYCAALFTKIIFGHATPPRGCPQLSFLIERAGSCDSCFLKNSCVEHSPS